RRKAYKPRLAAPQINPARVLANRLKPRIDEHQLVQSDRDISFGLDPLHAYSLTPAAQTLPSRISIRMLISTSRRLPVQPDSRDPIGKPVFRFAPSSNGALHLGHAYSAL